MHLLMAVSRFLRARVRCSLIRAPAISVMLSILQGGEFVCWDSLRRVNSVFIQCPPSRPEMGLRKLNNSTGKLFARGTNRPRRGLRLWTPTSCSERRTVIFGSVELVGLYFFAAAKCG